MQKFSGDMHNGASVALRPASILGLWAFKGTTFAIERFIGLILKVDVRKGLALAVIY